MADNNKCSMNCSLAPDGKQNANRKIGGGILRHIGYPMHYERVPRYHSFVDKKLLEGIDPIPVSQGKP